MLESVIDGGTFIVTKVTSESAHAQVFEEYTQNRDPSNPILVRERKRIIDGTDDGFWMCLEVLVQLLR